MTTHFRQRHGTDTGTGTQVGTWCLLDYYGNLGAIYIIPRRTTVSNILFPPTEILLLTWVHFYFVSSYIHIYIYKIFDTINITIQGVPLATKPDISLIILIPMKILQRNLNRSTFVAWEMKRNVCVCGWVGACICVWVWVCLCRAFLRLCAVFV